MPLIAIPASTGAMVRGLYRAKPSAPMITSSFAQKSVSWAALNAHHISTNKNIFRAALQSPVIVNSKQYVPVRNFSASRPAQGKWYDFVYETKWQFKKSSAQAQDLFDVIQNKLQGKSSEIFENQSVQQLIGRFPREHINARFMNNGARETLLEMIIRESSAPTSHQEIGSGEQISLIKACINNGVELQIKHTISAIDHTNYGAFKFILMHTAGDAFSALYEYSSPTLTQKLDGLNQAIEKLKNQRDELYKLQEMKVSPDGRTGSIHCSPEFWNCLTALMKLSGIKRRVEAMLEDLNFYKNEFLKKQQRSDHRTDWKYKESAHQGTQTHRDSHNNTEKTKDYSQYTQPNEKELIEFLTKCKKGANSQEILGVNSRASKDELKKAYRLLVLKCHPDKFAYNKELMKLANEATQNLNSAYKMCI